MSETNTSASTSTFATAVTGNDSFALADDVKKYNTDELISFLRVLDLGLGEGDEDIIREEKINGSNFLDLTLENLERWGMFEDSAKTLANFVKIKKDFGEVLGKYGVEDERITNIPQFIPKTYKIDDEDEELLHCLKVIKLRLNVLVTGVESDSNVAIRCEYISPVIIACICIIRRHTGKNLKLNLQSEVDSEEFTCRVDYTIIHPAKAFEKLICITLGKQSQIAFRFAQNVIKCKGDNQTNKRKQKTDDTFDKEYDYPFGVVTTASEWYFLHFTSDRISGTIRNPFNIRFVKSALEEGSEDEKELRKKVKEVIEVIVGLLMNLIDDEKEPEMKNNEFKDF